MRLTTLGPWFASTWIGNQLASWFPIASWWRPGAPFFDSLLVLLGSLMREGLYLLWAPGKDFSFLIKSMISRPLKPFSKTKERITNRWIHILGGRNIRRVDHRAARRRLVGRLVGPTTRNYSTSWTYYVAALISRRVWEAHRESFWKWHVDVSLSKC